MASAPALAPNNSPHRRGAPRLQVHIPGRLILLAGDYSCGLENVSVTGARLVTDGMMKIGDEGILLCPPLEVFFITRWVDGKAAGVEFQEEVELGAIRMLRWHNDRYSETQDAKLHDMMEDWVAGKIS